MSANIDADSLLDVSFREPPAGSCITKELLAELARLLVVKFKSSVDPEAVPMRVSADANNLASLDSTNSILVPSPLKFSDEKTWTAGTTTEITFDGWTSLGIDATSALVLVRLMLDPGEAGIPVLLSPGPGAGAIRPCFEITSITSSQVKVKVYNLASDCVVHIDLRQDPTAGESP